MKAFATWTRGILVAAMATLVGSAPALAATFVYVSNAEDGDIAAYRMLDSGELQPGARTKAASVVMPMVVSPDRRFLYAASRSKPYLVHVYAIDAGTGALTPLSTSPLAESFPYISLDKTGRFLFGASYGGHLVSVNAVGTDRHVHVFRARRQDGTTDRSELRFRAAARFQAGARCAARRRRWAQCAAAAQYRQRYLGRGHPYDAERQVPVHLGAHGQRHGRV